MIFFAHSSAYDTPKTTGQAHHGARAVFLTQQIDDNLAECLLRPAHVCAPGEFARASQGDDDVFLCEYEYDTMWQVRLQQLLCACAGCALLGHSVRNPVVSYNPVFSSVGMASSVAGLMASCCGHSWPFVKVHEIIL